MKIKLPKIPKAIEREATIKIFYGMFGIAYSIAQKEGITNIEDLKQLIDTMSPTDLEKYQIKKGENKHESLDSESREIKERH